MAIKQFQPPLVYDTKYWPCWNHILEFLRLEEIIELGNISNEFHSIADRFYECGEVKIDDLFLQKFTCDMEPNWKLYSHIGFKATKLCLSFLQDDLAGEIYKKIFSFFRRGKELRVTMVGCVILHIPIKVLVHSLRLIHCSMEHTAEPTKFFRLASGHLTMYYSDCWLLGAIENVRHLRHFTEHGWSGMEAIKNRLETLEINAPRIGEPEEKITFRALRRMSITSNFIYDDMNVRFPSLQHLQFNLRDRFEGYERTILPWRCIKRLRTLSIRREPEKLAWLYVFKNLRQLTIHSWQPDPEPKMFTRYKSIRPQVKISYSPPEIRPPASGSILTYLPDHLLRKIIGYLDVDEDEEERDELAKVCRKFKFLCYLEKYTKNNVTLIDENFVCEHPVDEYLALYKEFGKRVTRLFVAELVELELLEILPFFTNLVYLGLGKIGLKNIKGVRDFPLVKELHITESVVTTKRYLKTLSARLQGSLETLTGPASVINSFKNIKHLGIKVGELANNLALFWKHNETLETLKIMSYKSDVHLNNTSGRVKQNWAIIGSLKNLKSFTCDLLEAPFMALPFDTLEELHFINKAYEVNPQSVIDLIGKMGTQLKVLTVSIQCTEEGERDLHQAIEHLTPHLEQLELGSKSKELQGLGDKLSNLKVLKFPFHSFDRLKDAFRDLPKLEEVHANFDCDDWRIPLNCSRNMRKFKRDFPLLKVQLAPRHLSVHQYYHYRSTTTEEDYAAQFQ